MSLLPVIEGRYDFLGHFTVYYRERGRYEKRNSMGTNRDEAGYRIIELIHILVCLDIKPDRKVDIKGNSAIEVVQIYMKSMTLTRGNNDVTLWPREHVNKYYHWILHLQLIKGRAKKKMLFDMIKSELFRRNLVRSR